MDGQQIPELVHLHPLPGEGHLSAFCYNDKIHRETLTTLFGVSGGSRATEHVGSNPEELEKTGSPDVIVVKGAELQQEDARAQAPQISYFQLSPLWIRTCEEPPKANCLYCAVRETQRLYNQAGSTKHPAKRDQLIWGFMVFNILLDHRVYIYFCIQNLPQQGSLCVAASRLLAVYDVITSSYFTSYLSHIVV